MLYLRNAKENFNMLGIKLSDLLVKLNDWEKDELFQIPNLVKHKAYILLSSLVLQLDFKWPLDINPTLRNSVQFEWEILDSNHINWYFEIEVFEDKTSMLLAWRAIDFSSKGDKSVEEFFDKFKTFSFTFDENEFKYEDFPFTIISFFRMKSEVIKDENVVNIMNHFTKNIDKEDSDKK